MFYRNGILRCSFSLNLSNNNSLEYSRFRNHQRRYSLCQLLIPFKVIFTNSKLLRNIIVHHFKFLNNICQLSHEQIKITHRFKLDWVFDFTHHLNRFLIMVHILYIFNRICIPINPVLKDFNCVLINLLNLKLKMLQYVIYNTTSYCFLSLEIWDMYNFYCLKV